MQTLAGRLKALWNCKERRDDDTGKVQKSDRFQNLHVRLATPVGLAPDDVPQFSSTDILDPPYIGAVVRKSAVTSSRRDRPYRFAGYSTMQLFPPPIFHQSSGRLKSPAGDAYNDE